MRLKPTLLLGRLDNRPESLSWTLIRSTSFWVVLSYSILYLAAYHYCSHTYSHDPTSFFFDPSKGYQRVYSLKREKQADAFIETANRSARQTSSQSSPSICLGIATIARTGEQYIRRTIGSLLEGLSHDQRDSIYLVVFFAQTDPSQHPIYNEPWFNNVADEILQYDVRNETMDRLRSLEENHNFWNKSMFDYEHLLSKCVDTGSDWIMIVEDDVLAKQGWYAQATDALSDIQLRMKGHGWLYLRLFYTEKLFGWNSEEWPRYLGWSILAFVVTATTLMTGRSYSRWLRKHLSNISITVVCCLCLPATILLYFMAGRVSMQPPPPGLDRMEQFGCCSQGLIFPRLMDAVKYATDQHYYVDMTLERLANSEGLPRFALVPPLLQHVGSKSSKGSKFDEAAKTIWNFAFENYE